MKYEEIQTNSNDDITFSITFYFKDASNISNIKLDNFTWTEYIPYEDSKVTKMVKKINSNGVLSEFIERQVRC